MKAFLGLLLVIGGIRVSALDLGVNIAWVGNNYSTDLTSRFDENLLETSLENAVQINAKVVRLWLFENRQGMVLSNSAPQSQGVTPEFLKNLEKVLLLIKQKNLKVYITFLNAAVLPMPYQTGEEKDYFWNLFNNKFGEQDAYHKNILAPTLSVLMKYKKTVYGIDLVNEIQGAILRGYFSWLNSGINLKPWLARTVNFVKSVAPGIPLTSSSGWFAVNEINLATGLFSGIGLDFYDLHAYSDLGIINNIRGICELAKHDNVPLVLGEFGQLSRIESEELQLISTEGFFHTAKHSCIRMMMPWRLDAHESYWALIAPDGRFKPAAKFLQSKFSSDE